MEAMCRSAGAAESAITPISAGGVGVTGIGVRVAGHEIERAVPCLACDIFCMLWASPLSMARWASTTHYALPSFMCSASLPWSLYLGPDGTNMENIFFFHNS